MKTNLLLFFKLVLVSAFWGGTFIAGRVATRTMDPIVIAFFRFLVASLLLAIYLGMKDRKCIKPNLRQLMLVLAAGLTGIVSYNLFFLNGLKHIEANRASLIVALSPAAIMVVAGWLGMEKLTGERIVGVLLALFGVSIVLTDGRFADIGTSLDKGELLILGCVLSWVMYTVLGRILVQEFSPLVVTTYSSIAGCLGLTIPAILNMQNGISFNLSAISAVLYLGIFGTTLAFVWYYEGVEKLGLTRAGIFINLVPVWAVLLSALLLSEQIAPMSILGGLVVIMGVLLTNRKRLLRPNTY
jgi:drug/metabolite transporter (DMT)-like permease